MALEKQKAKVKNEKKLISDSEQFKTLLTQYITDPNATQTVDLTNNGSIKFENISSVEAELEKKVCGTTNLQTSID